MCINYSLRCARFQNQSHYVLQSRMLVNSSHPMPNVGTYPSDSMFHTKLDNLSLRLGFYFPLFFDEVKLGELNRLTRFLNAFVHIHQPSNYFKEKKDVKNVIRLLLLAFTMRHFSINNFWR